MGDAVNEINVINFIKQIATVYSKCQLQPTAVAKKVKLGRDPIFMSK